MANPKATFRPRRGTKIQWETKDPILDIAEQGFETDTGKFKIGDGYSSWTTLPYFVPKTNEDTPPPPVEVPPSDLLSHILDPTPHPVYDDGPSLLLIYQNAKV